MCVQSFLLEKKDEDFFLNVEIFHLNRFLLH